MEWRSIIWIICNSVRCCYIAFYKRYVTSSARMANEVEHGQQTILRENRLNAGCRIKLWSVLNRATFMRVIRTGIPYRVCHRADSCMNPVLTTVVVFAHWHLPAIFLRFAAALSACIFCNTTSQTTASYPRYQSFQRIPWRFLVMASTPHHVSSEPTVGQPHTPECKVIHTC